ncbi:hypothetical protein TNCV_1163931 [Trichonephila clavipes]|nr:hypothetical protein TNCV_1163931 [Trichonephila clavipes]
MITEGEKWVTYDNIVRKQSWSKRGEAAQMVAKPGLTSRKYGQSASVHKKMTRRKTNLSLNSCKAKSERRVIAHQTEEEQASVNERSQQRMTEIRAYETAEERATRFEDAHLRVRQ